MENEIKNSRKLTLEKLGDIHQNQANTIRESVDYGSILTV